MSPPEATLKKEKLRVLNLEDNPNDSELIQEQLGTEWPALEFLRVDTRAAFVRALDEFKPDVVLSDFKLPDMNGRDALNIVRQTHPDIPVIIVTGALGDEQAIELLVLGARDYILKDRLVRIAPALQRVLSEEQDITARKQTEAQIAEQLDELKRWYAAMTGREMRVMELKREVNELLKQAGQPPRYLSVEQTDTEE